MHMKRTPVRPPGTGRSELDDLLSTREVARLAGVGPSAVKRWSDAGLLACQKTAGGHRRFARAEVDRLLRHQAAEGPGGDDPWIEGLLDAHETFGISALLLAERGRAGAWHRVVERVGLAVTELGRRWQAGTVSIVEEHLASERLARALARIAESIPISSAAPVALLACAEGDDHTLGLSLVEVVLREAGWSTRWAGRQTPLEEIERLLRQGEVGMLALSASEASADAVGLRRQAEALGRRCRALGVTLVLGGHGAWPERPRHGALVRSLGRLHELAVTERERRTGSPVA
jgi:MerR family transcriptional regulator, light-induced transcriptional regulator